jgi:hypothetical protein
MRRILALAATIAAFASVGGAATPITATAKSCSSGWTHAVINGSHKCLRRGQFCSRGADKQYHRFGYHCHKRDARGNYHLT